MNALGPRFLAVAGDVHGGAYWPVVTGEEVTGLGVCWPWRVAVGGTDTRFPFAFTLTMPFTLLCLSNFLS